MSYNKDLPKNEIVVVVVDNGGDTTIGIEPQEFRALVFLRNEIEVHRLHREKGETLMTRNKVYEPSIS